MIGFGGEYSKWPSHYTSGGKIRFHGKASNIKFADPPKHEMFKSGCNKMDEILEQVFQAKMYMKKQLGLIPAGDATREALRYPFRAHAVKHILFVPGDTYITNVPLVSIESLPTISFYI